MSSGRFSFFVFSLAFSLVLLWIFFGRDANAGELYMATSLTHGIFLLFGNGWDG